MFELISIVVRKQYSIEQHSYIKESLIKRIKVILF